MNLIEYIIHLIILVLFITISSDYLPNVSALLSHCLSELNLREVKKKHNHSVDAECHQEFPITTKFLYENLSYKEIAWLRG